jgi:hypothetical protein
MKCFNCQVAGDKAAECKKEGGGAHTGPQQPSAKKKMFQTAAAQLKEMERVDKLVSAMQLHGKYVEKLMEAIASLPDSGVGCKLCVHACRARASVHASGGRELRRVRRGFPAGEVGGAGNVVWRDSHQSPLRRPKQREQLQCTYPTVSCLAHSVVVPCDNSALYASRSSLFAPYAPVSPLRI